MLTSASCLKKILVQCSHGAQDKTRFSIVLRSVLGEDEVSEVDAIKRIHEITSKIKSDINNLPHSEDQKRHLLNLFGPYVSHPGR